MTMKNKYQEALNELREISSSRQQNELYDVIQELIDKERPMKPIEKYDTDIGYFTVCRNCKNVLEDDFITCPYCEQKIDRR